MAVIIYDTSNSRRAGSLSQSNGLPTRGFFHPVP